MEFLVLKLVRSAIDEMIPLKWILKIFRRINCKEFFWFWDVGPMTTVVRMVITCSNLLV